jgi:hypothetical protein
MHVLDGVNNTQSLLSSGCESIAEVLYNSSMNGDDPWNGSSPYSWGNVLS